MARNERSSARSERGSEKRERPAELQVTSWEVQKARSTRGGVYFSLVLNGITINNCRIAETREGVKFISMPQYKGSDGNYYSTVYCRIPDDVQEEIIDAVYDQAEDR